MTAPAHAAPLASAAVECPKAYPLSSVSAGLQGQGQTVVTGKTPQPFKVDVLGVLQDGIGAGRDMIIIKVSDLPGKHVIDQGKGIWAGMSGSPVYVGDKLLGSVSYGFTAAPSPIGGLTPAGDMLDLLTLSGSDAAKTQRKPATSPQATLSKAAKTRLASEAGVATPKGTLQQLVNPLAVSGLGTRRLDKLQAATDAAGWSVKAYAAGRQKAPTAAPTARPRAGGNFAATLSYGDVTAAAIGTTTYVCGDRAIAFGHPFNLSGPASYGANDADSLAIVTDNTLGSFKMANIGQSFGTVDQDRTSGIRADLSAVPTGTDVSTTVRDLDNGKVRNGSTTVVDRRSLPGLLPDIVFASQDAVFDEWGDGTATSSWTITGKRAGGKPFTVSRSNRWADRDDVTIDPAFDIASAADSLLNN
ncbi:MAG: SpoIVB peptidase S55 domain-containing protein, partial [Janthinobacterium lividum]